MKTCSSCLESKDFSLFIPDLKMKDGYRNVCRLCVNLKAKIIRDKKSQESIRKTRDYRLKYIYGISLQDYEWKLEAQDYQCAICDIKLPPFGRQTNLDHNHTTGKIRDILCGRCNRAIGLMEDDYKLLKTASKYLERHSESTD